jgi:site-specific DNA-methyltransferase (cytosine-N4-specific)
MVAARAEEAASVIDAKSLQLMFTSPLFPGIKKAYGAMSPAEWLPWMIELVAGVVPLVAADGVLAFHLGQVHYRGTCAISSYRERFVIALQDQLGLYQQQPFHWEHETRKGTLEWSGVRKMLPHNTLDPIYLFSKASQPQFDVSAIKMPYADPGDPRLAAAGRKERRPGGLDFGPDSYRDRGGAMASNVIRTGPVGGNDSWRRALKEAGMAAHPCPMPLAVPARVIQAATKPGQRVGDIMSGSGSVGAAAEMLGREWIGLDHHRYYLHGAALRPEYRDAPGYRLCSA